LLGNKNPLKEITRELEGFFKSPPVGEI